MTTARQRDALVTSLQSRLGLLDKARLRLAAAARKHHVAANDTLWLDELHRRMKVELAQARAMPVDPRPAQTRVRRAALALLDAHLAARTDLGPARRQRALAKALSCTEAAVRRARTEYRQEAKRLVAAGGFEARHNVVSALRTVTPTARLRYRKLLTTPRKK